MNIPLKPIILILFYCAVSSCGQQDEYNSYQQIVNHTDHIFEDLVQIKKDLHKHPELSGQETRTAAIVAAYLRNLDIEVKTGISGNAVIGILKGDKKGKNIAWRADMDAIPIEPKDTVAYASHNHGIAHRCGHDVHTTIGLGIANVLSKQKENLAGTVYFIFQPSEETFVGAKNLVDNGLFDIIHPQEIYGLHIGPAEKGTVNTKPKELFAYQKTIEINLKKQNNQAEIEKFLNSTVQGFERHKSNSSPWSLHHLTDVKLGLESKETSYQDYFIFQQASIKEKDDFILYSAHFLETNAARFDDILSEAKEKILNSKYKNSLISIKYATSNPTVYNHPELTGIALETIDSLYNNELIKPIYGQIPYFNEDFIYYQQRVPGVMFLLGGSNVEQGINAMPHTPDFDVDDETIRSGVTCFSSLIMARTHAK